jgi:hypothetical protein
MVVGSIEYDVLDVREGFIPPNKVVHIVFTEKQ